MPCTLFVLFTNVILAGFGFDCLGRTIDCPRPQYATIGSGILLGTFGLWLVIITYLLVSAFMALSKLPYAQYRVANLIVRLQVRPVVCTAEHEYGEGLVRVLNAMISRQMPVSSVSHVAVDSHRAIG